MRFDEDDALFWTPTLTGRARVRRFEKNAAGEPV
jgi:hypothetical protein